MSRRISVRLLVGPRSDAHPAQVEIELISDLGCDFEIEAEPSGDYKIRLLRAVDLNGNAIGDERHGNGLPLNDADRSGDMPDGKVVGVSNELLGNYGRGLGNFSVGHSNISLSSIYPTYTGSNFPGGRMRAWRTDENGTVELDPSTMLPLERSR